MMTLGWGRRVGFTGSLRWFAFLAAIGVWAVGVWGCREQAPSNFDSNIPPETFISGAPAESTLSYYQVHLRWGGTDPDGLVDHYEFSVTDSNQVPADIDPDFSGYYATTRTDSLFRLSADAPQILGHRFYVRAVDNEGKVDPTPAWTYFVSHDYNFPSVVWERASGNWTDKYGVKHTLAIKSNDRFDPTDTIGVGGSISEGCIQCPFHGWTYDASGANVLARSTWRENTRTSTSPNSPTMTRQASTPYSSAITAKMKSVCASGSTVLMVPSPGPLPKKPPSVGPDVDRNELNATMQPTWSVDSHTGMLAKSPPTVSPAGTVGPPPIR